MTQLTIRRLDPIVLDGLKKRAAEAGRSMEEEARKILTDAIEERQIARQREWLKDMEKTRREIFGDKVFPDSSEEIRRMRDERTEYLAQLITPKKRKR